ncbi:MAG: hypothetical protein F6K35_33515 [Okeania sp. SIO2H7]|nr:hypothetical protein [Okeania sp. SIO2H7]
MAIEEVKPEVDDNALLEEGSSAERMDSEFLAYLEESQNEFEGWLERVRDRRERSLSVLDEVMGDLERSQSSLNLLQGKEEKSGGQDKSYAFFQKSVSGDRL